MKIILSLVLIFVMIAQSVALRRTPKVYNALITTDQNLTPSRAYPVIQPHLQETYALPSYSYRSYAPFGFYNSGFHYGSTAASSIVPYNGFHNYPRLGPGLVEGRHFLPRDEIHTTLPPIPINDLGLPPSLIPINSFELGNLAPYPHTSHPLIYDQFAGYGGYLSNLLPPYPFYPPELDGGKGKKVPNKDEDKNSSESDGGSSGGNSGSSAAESGGSSDEGSGSSGGGSGSSGGGSGSSGGGSASSGGGSGSSGGKSGSSGLGNGSSGGGSVSSGGGASSNSNNSSGGGGGSSGSSGSSGGSSSSSSVSISTSTRSSRNLKKLE